MKKLLLFFLILVGLETVNAQNEIVRLRRLVDSLNARISWSDTSGTGKMITRKQVADSLQGYANLSENETVSGKYIFTDTTKIGTGTAERLFNVFGNALIKDGTLYFETENGAIPINMWQGDLTGIQQGIYQIMYGGDGTSILTGHYIVIDADVGGTTGELARGIYLNVSGATTSNAIDVGAGDTRLKDTYVTGNLYIDDSLWINTVMDSIEENSIDGADYNDNDIIVAESNQFVNKSPSEYWSIIQPDNLIYTDTASVMTVSLTATSLYASGSTIGLGEYSAEGNFLKHSGNRLQWVYGGVAFGTTYNIPTLTETNGLISDSIGYYTDQILKTTSSPTFAGGTFTGETYFGNDTDNGDASLQNNGNFINTGNATFAGDVTFGSDGVDVYLNIYGYPSMKWASNGNSYVYLDASGTSKSSLLNFSRSGSTAGYIEFDHNSVVSAESMNFNVSGSTDLFINGLGNTTVVGDLDVSGNIKNAAGVPASPADGHFYFLNNNNADADTIAVYNGTSWKYFISD